MANHGRSQLNVRHDVVGVTVVTPSLNQAHYLAQCLRSVELQGLEHVEQLVVDGDSADNSEEVASRFPHARFVRRPGASQSEALNWGFMNARYSVICWLNADDLLMPSAADRAIEAIRSSGERTYVFGSFVEIDDAGRMVRYRPVPPVVFHAIRNYSIFVPTSGSFFTTQICRDGLLLQPDLHYIMDRDFILRLHGRGYRFVRADAELAGFRVHPKQKSGEGNNLEPRRIERLALNARYGGVWALGARLVPWNPVLGRLGYLYVGTSQRISLLLGRFAPKSGGYSRNEVSSWLDATRGRTDLS